MKQKLIILLVPVLFTAQACSLNLFKKPSPAGVIKTVNGGMDWQFSNVLKDTKSGSISSLNISKLDFDPTNRETVYASSYNGGLYKSEDSAGSWKIILSKILVYDFAINPQDPKIIYVAGYYGSFGKVLKTVDKGATWQEIYNEGSGDNIVRAVAINPTQPNQVVIGTASGEIIKSADGGISWKLAKNFDSRVNRITWTNNGFYVLLKTKGLSKSNDFGENFSDLTSSLTMAPGSWYSASATSIESFNQAYVDSVSSSLIYLATSKGLYKTTDEGKTWAPQSLPLKPEDSNARAVTVAKNSSNIVFASVGPTMYKSTDGGSTFQTQSIATRGFINYILIDPQLPQIVYGGIYIEQ